MICVYLTAEAFLFLLSLSTIDYFCVNIDPHHFHFIPISSDICFLLSVPQIFIFYSPKSPDINELIIINFITKGKKKMLTSIIAYLQRWVAYCPKVGQSLRWRERVVESLAIGSSTFCSSPMTMSPSFDRLAIEQLDHRDPFFFIANWFLLKWKKQTLLVNKKIG